MLIRLGVVIGFIGRTAFLLGAIGAGGMIAIGAVATMCATDTLARELYNMIAYSTVLLLAAFATLTVCSAISWIITGLGSLVSFGGHLILRVGTFLLAMGLVMLILTIDLRYVAGGCQAGTPASIMGLGLGVLMVGACVQTGAMYLLGAHSPWGARPAQEQLRGEMNQGLVELKSELRKQ